VRVGETKEVRGVRIDKATNDAENREELMPAEIEPNQRKTKRKRKPQSKFTPKPKKQIPTFQHPPRARAALPPPPSYLDLRRMLLPRASERGVVLRTRRLVHVAQRGEIFLGARACLLGVLRREKIKEEG
jgi:hypothetical protein